MKLKTAFKSGRFEYIDVEDNELAVCIGVTHSDARKYYQEGEVFRCKNSGLYPLVKRKYSIDQSFGGYEGYWARYKLELKSYEEML